MSQCEHFEPDENGDICHASEEDECPNNFECTAKYNIYGRLLTFDCTGDCGQCRYQFDCDVRDWEG